jgi:hypothetical protein
MVMYEERIIAKNVIIERKIYHRTAAVPPVRNKSTHLTGDLYMKKE